MLYRVPIVSIFTFLTIAPLVWPIHLTGPCPMVPASNFVGFSSHGYQRFPKLLAGVPFAPDRLTYLFLNLSNTNRHHFKFCLEAGSQQSNAPFEIFISHENEGGSNSWGYLDSDPLNISVTLNSSVEGKRGKLLYSSSCFKEITHDVRMWIDDLFIIIWSCIDVSHIVRDEAAILLLHDNAIVAEFKDIIRLMKRFSEGYLSKGLMNEISWPTTERGEETPQVYFPFRCPSGNKQVIPIAALWLIAILILVLIAIWLIKKGQSNIVKPVGGWMCSNL